MSTARPTLGGVYLDYLKERAAIIALFLGLVAVVIAFSKDDLLYGLDLIWIAFIILWPVTEMRNYWIKRGPEWRTQFALMTVLLAFALGYTITFYAGHFQKTTTAFAYVGGMMAVLVIINFIFYVIPAAEKRRKVCPDCLSRSDIEAKVCKYCHYGWEPSS